MTLLSRREWIRRAAALATLSAHAGATQLGGGSHEFTILYTNDFHSAFRPVPAFWLPGSPNLGGAAHLATLVERERAVAGTSFLLDSGDMFTGSLSTLTQGAALMDMMSLMRYDALGVGNHEFDYGWKVFDRAMLRVPFPVLCCNIRHRGNGLRFTRPYTVIERNGVRLGVIGVMGTNAARFTIMPSKVAELEFTDPVEETRAAVSELRDAVDAVIVLAHQGLPGPMQSDAENDPEVQRPLDEDLKFCASVKGIAVYIAAHSHHGLEQPIVHPETGTIITQTYGYGTRLGRIRLALRDRKVVRHDVRLLKVWSDKIPPHRDVANRIAHFRNAVAGEIGGPLGNAAARFTRKYNRESTLGSFATDVMRERAESEVALTNAGGLRADILAGVIDRGHVLDAFPFVNTSVTMAVSGGDLRAAVEQGLSLNAGMVQVSGMEARYDLKRSVGERLVSLTVAGRPVENARKYRVTTNSFMAEGGDGYASLKRGERIKADPLLSDLIADHIRKAGTIKPPPLGRLVDVSGSP